MPEYILDANIFIDSHNRHYGMDYCPAFWDWLVTKNKAGRVYSIDRIATEIINGGGDGDLLCNWAKELGAEFFLPFDQDATNALPQVVLWAQNQTRFRPSAIQSFLACADLYLVAYALAHSCIIVTFETSAPDSKSKVKIPDVCIGLGVRTIGLWELLRTEGARFVLSS